MEIVVRTAHWDDVKEILYLMRKLAMFQGLEDKFEPHSDWLRIQMGPTGDPKIRGFIAHTNDRPIGYALYYLRDYASFRTKWKALHLEDLFVEEDFRGNGVGRELLRQVAQQALHYNVEYVSLEVHEQNTEAKDGYAKLGARPPEESIWEPLIFGLDSVKNIAE